MKTQWIAVCSASSNIKSFWLFECVNYESNLWKSKYIFDANSTQFFSFSQSSFLERLNSRLLPLNDFKAWFVSLFYYHFGCSRSSLLSNSVLSAIPHNYQKDDIRDSFESLNLKMWKINLNSLKTELLIQKVMIHSIAPWQLSLEEDPRRQTWVWNMLLPNLTGSVRGRKDIWES